MRNFKKCLVTLLLTIFTSSFVNATEDSTEAKDTEVTTPSLLSDGFNFKAKSSSDIGSTVFIPYLGPNFNVLPRSVDWVEFSKYIEYEIDLGLLIQIQISISSELLIFVSWKSVIYPHNVCLLKMPRFKFIPAVGQPVRFVSSTLSTSQTKIFP